MLDKKPLNPEEVIISPVYGDGSCFYRTLSLYLTSDQSYYKIIRDIIYETSKENKENLNLPENFEELMNAATNGNYSTVVSDIKNGTTTPLDMTPVSSESSSAAETSAYNSQTGSFSTLSQALAEAIP